MIARSSIARQPPTIMNLVIRALSLNDQPISQTIVGRFGQEGGTIGRSDANTMTLPDPGRQISRLQAEISVQGSGFRARNAGAANVIFVNGRALALGELHALNDGDELRIGGYALAVQVRGDAAGPGLARRDGVAAYDVILGSAAEQRTDPLAVRAPVRAPAPPFGAGAPAGVHPFADLLGPSGDVAGVGRADPFDFAQPRAGHGAGAPWPADVDPFDDPAPPPQVLVDAAAPPADFDGPLAGYGPNPVSGSSLEAFGLGAGAPAVAADSLDAFLGGRAAPPSAALDDLLGRQPSSDPFAIFDGPEGLAPPPPVYAAADHVPELQAAYRPPPVRSEPVEPAPPPPPAPPRREAAGAPALWQAFCTGLGIDLPRETEFDAAEMRAIGMLLREAVEGALKLMQVRASTKNELRANVTTIRTRNNNPLKFSPTAENALTQMLRPPQRGFMAGPAAMQDAMQDLMGHSIGTMVGMKAALAGVLAQFEPRQLEARLVGRGLLDSLVPATRKARLWDLYLQHFDSIRNDAQDDFHHLFGAAFVAAYEEQIDLLRQPRA